MNSLHDDTATGYQTIPSTFAPPEPRVEPANPYLEDLITTYQATSPETGPGTG